MSATTTAMPHAGFTGANRGETIGTFRLPRPQAQPSDTASQRPQFSHSNASTVKPGQPGAGATKPDQFWNDLKQIQTQKVEVRKREPATGHAFLDFELNDAQIETKVKQLTQRELAKQQQELRSLVDQRTSNLRDFVETQARSSQLSMATLRGDMKQTMLVQQTQQIQMQQNVTSNYKMAGNQSGVMSRGPAFGNGGIEADLKQALMQDLQEQLAMETLQCKPIQGVDIPLMTKAEILSVEEIEGRDMRQMVPQRGGILSMLLPNELKVASLEFLEEEDMTHMDVQVLPKKTPGQSLRETKLKQEQLYAQQADQIICQEQEDDLLKVSGEQREKTIKCLLKVLQYQVHSVEDQAAQVLQHAKANDLELEAYRREMLEQERKLKLQEMNEALDRTKKIAGTYKSYNQNDDDGEGTVDPSNERHDLAEIIADNNLLMGRVDQLLRQDGTAKVTSSDRDGDEEQAYSLTSTLIDELYEQCNTQQLKKKQAKQIKTQKQIVAVHQTHHLIERKKQLGGQWDVKVSPQKAKKQTSEEEKPVKSVLKKGKTTVKGTEKQVSYQEQQAYESFDFRPAMSQAEIDRLKKQKLADIKSKHQIVFFPAASSSTSANQASTQPLPSQPQADNSATVIKVQDGRQRRAQEIAANDEKQRQKRQQELAKLDKLLNQEVSSALTVQADLMQQVLN